MTTTPNPPFASSLRKHFGLLVLALLTLGATVAGVLWSRSAAGTSSVTRGGEASAPASGGVGAVCFGYVDLEQGVTALFPLQPGRVVKVEVREGEVVPVGTIL